MKNQSNYKFREHFPILFFVLLFFFTNSVLATSKDYFLITNCTENSCFLDDIHIYNKQIFNSNQEIQANIYVHNGGDLTVAATLSFSESHGIIVERGGKLNLDFGKLTTAPNAKWWNGIEVEGNNTINQPDDYLSVIDGNDAGIVFVRNNAIIENALIGISTIRHNERWNEAYWGGLIQIKDSYFKHNRKAVEFMRYRVGLNGINKSYITNAEFDGLSPNSSSTEGVTIWSSDGIKYERNRHYDLDKSGISIVDGWIKVVDSNNFEKNKAGVSCYATAPINSSVQVGLKKSGTSPNVFSHNQTAIECFGADGLSSGDVLIYSNEFFDGNYGINIQGNCKYIIGFNGFGDQTYGIGITNSGNEESLIHCNFFQNNIYSLMYQGNNSNSQFKYNSFYKITGNAILIYSNSNTPTSIKSNQGNEGDPAENCFALGENPINQIYTYGPTVFFNYYTPTNYSTNYCLSGSAVPFCDLYNGCDIPNNYLKVKTVNLLPKNEDCDKLKSQKPPTFTLKQYQYFDSLFTLHCKQSFSVGPDFCPQVKEYAALREQAMRDVVRTYLAANNWPAIETLLNSANFEAAKLTLYGLYFRNRNWTSASTVLAALPSRTVAQRQFIATQSIALEYAKNPANLYLDPYKDSLLHAIATDEWPAAAYAKSLLYLIKGEMPRFKAPVLPREFNAINKLDNSLSEIAKVFPNPTSQSLNIEITEPELELVKIEILSLLGRKISEKEANSKTEIIDVSTIANGSYLLRIQLSNDSFVNKIFQIIH